MNLFGSNGKSRNGNGNGHVRWEWLRGRPVTGHLNHRKRFVDVRKATTEVYVGEGGNLYIAFDPAKGVDANRVVFPAEVIETRDNRFGRCEVTKIRFEFFDKQLELKLPRRHRVLLD